MMHEEFAVPIPSINALGPLADLVRGFAMGRGVNLGAVTFEAANAGPVTRATLFRRGPNPTMPQVGDTYHLVLT